jgi:hypothetical protein
MSSIQEWMSFYDQTARSLQQTTKQVNERIVGIRGGQSRTLFTTMHARNTQALQGIRQNHDKLTQELERLSRGGLPPKDVQANAAKLEKLKLQLDETERRSKMSEAEIVSQGRFFFFHLSLFSILCFFFSLLETLSSKALVDQTEVKLKKLVR